MSVTVASGFGPAGYALYGRNFISTFCQHWPVAVSLMLYVEETPPDVFKLRGRSVAPVPLDSCAGVTDFIARHSGVPERRGQTQSIDKPYNFRFDAVRFCRQCFIPEEASRHLPDGEILVWCDADVVSFAPVPVTLAADLLGKSDLCYLGRSKHSEIGFWACRLNPQTRAFLADFADTYRSDRVFDLKEWHSAYVFDHCRAAFEAAGGRARNLTPGGKGHVWFQSPLGRYLDHLKGDRKKMGRSPERRT